MEPVASDTKFAVVSPYNNPTCDLPKHAYQGQRVPLNPISAISQNRLITEMTLMLAR
ncbi:hypothetical protein FD25_GL001889 [Levilactobacillus acidifarinae DSM 19394]|uniref:Uncharacterized protein n=1 Tax=Levilactobacillus acidifarinae DSM 19394 = JCM 15949 TaxID=1423715 RepID=A0A0R1LKB5_9LACO|nr:hypothetical protein FD25_GL001889 [Levilactobacillus acidifarinae DSM 19394]